MPSTGMNGTNGGKQCSPGGILHCQWVERDGVPATQRPRHHLFYVALGQNGDDRSVDAELDAGGNHLGKAQLRTLGGVEGQVECAGGRTRDADGAVVARRLRG